MFWCIFLKEEKVRLWSLHPEYLDTKGLLAVWREGLLARKVLCGATRGYRNHPQLIRFRGYEYPLVAIDSFLYFVWEEAKRRGYSFDLSRIESSDVREGILPVTNGQVNYEFIHLCAKLQVRERERYEMLCSQEREVRVNPVFYVVEGDVEPWERVK